MLVHNALCRRNPLALAGPLRAYRLLRYRNEDAGLLRSDSTGPSSPRILCRVPLRDFGQDGLGKRKVTGVGKGVWHVWPFDGGQAHPLSTGVELLDAQA